MMTLGNIVDWLRHRAGGLYGDEPVTQLEHTLQCAALARLDMSKRSLMWQGDPLLAEQAAAFIRQP